MQPSDEKPSTGESPLNNETIEYGDREELVRYQKRAKFIYVLGFFASTALSISMAFFQLNGLALFPLVFIAGITKLNELRAEIEHYDINIKKTKKKLTFIFWLNWFILFTGSGCIFFCFMQFASASRTISVSIQYFLVWVGVGAIALLGLPFLYLVYKYLGASKALKNVEEEEEDEEDGQKKPLFKIRY